MLVVDASALAHVLTKTALATRFQSAIAEAGRAHAPGLIDVELTSVMRGAERRKLGTAAVEEALAQLREFPLVRYENRPLLGRAWQLRRNFTVYDALYVALAEVIDASLLTADRRLARAVTRHTEVSLVEI